MPPELGEGSEGGSPQGSRAEIPIVVGSELTGRAVPGVPITSDTSIEAALGPVKLYEGICEGGCDIGSRFAIQALSLD